MKGRFRGKKILTNRRPPSSSYGWFRLIIFGTAAIFALWVISRSFPVGNNDKIQLKPPSESSTLEEEQATSISTHEEEEASTDQSSQGEEFSSYGHLKPGQSGVFKVKKEPLKSYSLREKIVGDNLKKVFLDHHKFGTSDVPTKPGPICPDFEYCYKGFEGVGTCVLEDVLDEAQEPTTYPVNCPDRVASCIQEQDLRPHEKWAPQVLVLHNVYVNIGGQVFNATHSFDSNGCLIPQRFSHLPGRTNVVEFSELVSLVDWYGWNSRVNMLHLVPSIYLLGSVMPALRGVPVVYGQRLGHKRTQLQQMLAVGINSILGVELENLNPYILKEKQLFFAHKLFLPLRQHCERPSRSLWKHLRYNHFLAEDGLPIFKKNWVPRSVTAGGQPLAKSDDWLVLLSLKKERRPLVVSLKLEDYLKKIFPPSKVQLYYEGSVPMLKRKELLNKARLLISVHDNVLADMVFMPPGGAVVEIRPREEADATFHHLAEACELSYYLLFCEGKRGENRLTSALRVKDLKSVLDTLKSISTKFT